jgi:MSHA biogenesis protein MshQ
MTDTVMKKWLIPAVLVLLLAMDAAQAAVTFRAAATFKRRDPGTVTVNKPAGTVSGDLMLAAIATAYKDSATISAPAGWTLVRFSDKTSGDPANRLYTYYKVAGGSEPASYGWSFSGDHDGAVGFIASFIGVDTASPIDASAAQTTGSSVSHIAPTVTTTVAGDMLVTVHEFGSSRNWTKPTGMTEAADLYSQDSAEDHGVSMELNYEARPTAGATGTRTATASADADYGAAHAIALKAIAASAFDHLRIKHDGEGSNCAAESIIVEACADAGCTSLATSGGITASLQPFGTAISIGTSGTVTLSVTTPSPTGANTLGATSIAPTPANAAPVSCLNTVTSTASCSLPVSACPGGANFNCLETSITPYSSGTARLYTKLAGTAFSVDVLALNSSGTVETNYVASGATAKNVTVALFDDSASPQPACSAYASPVASQALSVDSTNAGRKTTASFNVSNAYTKLRCRVTDANVAPTVYGCSTDDFSLRPTAATLMVTSATAAAPSATATPAIKAGANFTLRATTNASSSYAGALTLDTSKLTAQTTSQDTSQQSGGTVGTLTPSALTANAVAVNAAYSEVGHLYLAPGAYRDDSFTAVDSAAGDCITSTASDNNLADTLVGGKYGCSIGNKTAVSLGRFYPDHFAISAPLSVVAACPPIVPFTYFGQDGFVASFTLTAQNAANGTTTNYAGAFAKLNLTNYSSYGFSTTSLPAGSSLASSATAPSGSWTNGVASVTSKHQISRPTVAAAETLVTVSAAPSDGEVPAATAAAVGSGTKLRYGRLKMQNAYGSELLALPVPLEAQYWAGSYYVTNTADSCTVIPMSSITMGNYRKQLGACETQISPVGNATMVAGKLPGTGLRLTNPGVNNAGSVDLGINLGAIPTGNTCVAATESAASAANMSWFGANPGARATFGVYKNANEFIYTREMY